MLNNLKKQFYYFFNNPLHIAPLAVLRIAFGSIMLVSTIRFMLKGWVTAFYIKPLFHFTFYGFDWVKTPDAIGMWSLFALLTLSTILITIGLFYRLSIITFFLCFTYVELIDKTTYLNHYYFVSVMAFLLILVPAHRHFSVDTWRKPQLSLTYVPGWVVNIFKLQLVLVYFFAGISKITYDWLIAAMPLKIWLPACSNLPIIGSLLTQTWVAYLFSWFGMLFDLLISFFLLGNKTRKPAYFMVIIFHLVTGWFFKIGMFPYIMIFVTTIFFSAETHLKIIGFFRKIFSIPHQSAEAQSIYQPAKSISKLMSAILILHFSLQLLLPFRYLLYPGELYWTEEGYRFSWRVMLMEKGGTAFFHIKDPSTGRQSEIINSQYLTHFQETQMATQPDMILQYAHFLAQEYKKKRIKNPIITTNSYVTLNGSGTQLYIDSTVNLATQRETFGHKKWILPFHKKY
jgi:hypothetical protein